jgi:hypothetical protein
MAGGRGTDTGLVVLVGLIQGIPMGFILGLIFIDRSNIVSVELLCQNGHTLKGPAHCTCRRMGAWAIIKMFGIAS